MVDPGLVVASAAALAALIGTIVAALAMVRQDRRMWRSSGLYSLWRVISMWDSPDMQAYRVSAATRLRQVPRIFDEHTEAVLNFFELLGYLLRTGTLTEDDVWTNFAWWAVCYWYVCEFDIKESRAADTTVYEDYEFLVERMRRYETKRRPELTYRETVPSSEAREAFLRRETRVRAWAAVAPGEASPAVSGS